MYFPRAPQSCKGRASRTPWHFVPRDAAFAPCGGSHRPHSPMKAQALYPKVLKEKASQDFPRDAQMGTSLPSQGAARLAVLHAARNGHISISRERALARRQEGASLMSLLSLKSLNLAPPSRVSAKSPKGATKLQPCATFNSSFVIHNS